MLGFPIAGDWTSEHAKRKIIDVQQEGGVPEKGTLTHAGVLVGYHHDKDPAKSYFIVKNSWGPGWARDGYGYLSYDYVMTYALQLAVIEAMGKR
jgi:C1A family cysteine protease